MADNANNMQVHEENKQIRENQQAIALQELTLRMTIFSVMVKLTLMITSSVILSQVWDETKSTALKNWLLVFIICDIFFLISDAYVYRHGITQQNLTEHPGYSRQIGFLTLFNIAWVIYGIVLISHDSSETEPSLHKMCLALIIMRSIAYTTPCWITCLFCLCIPCLMMILPRISSGRNAASAEDIKNLEVKKYDETFDENRKQCSICLEDYTKDEDVKFLPCKHNYHAKCIDPWLAINRTCPYCRADINKIPDSAA